VQAQPPVADVHDGSPNQAAEHAGDGRTRHQQPGARMFLAVSLSALSRAPSPSPGCSGFRAVRNRDRICPPQSRTAPPRSRSRT
jgi:hypothetical protein